MRDATHPNPIDASLRACTPGSPRREDAVLRAPGGHLTGAVLIQLRHTVSCVPLRLLVGDPLVPLRLFTLATSVRSRRTDAPPPPRPPGLGHHCLTVRRVGDTVLGAGGPGLPLAPAAVN